MGALITFSFAEIFVFVLVRAGGLPCLRMRNRFEISLLGFGSDVMTSGRLVRAL